MRCGIGKAPAEAHDLQGGGGGESPCAPCGAIRGADSACACQGVCPLKPPANCARGSGLAWHFIRTLIAQQQSTTTINLKIAVPIVQTNAYPPLGCTPLLHGLLMQLVLLGILTYGTACMHTAQVFPVWFAAQYCFATSLAFTSVTSNTVLSSTAALFTYGAAVLAAREPATWGRLACVLAAVTGTCAHGW